MKFAVKEQKWRQEESYDQSVPSTPSSWSKDVMEKWLFLKIKMLPTLTPLQIWSLI